MTKDKEICPYCGKEAEWVENKEVYGKNYGHSYMIWLCRPCDAYVGCHSNTKDALGTMANRDLRQYRKQTKQLFIDNRLGGDWGNKNKRTKGYLWLKNIFGKDFHFGASTIDECKKIQGIIYAEATND